MLENEGNYSSRWAAITSILTKIGCVPQTLSSWIKRTEVDSGTRVGVPSDIVDKIKAPERKVRELRQVNEILRRRPRILPRRSSTARSNDDKIY